MHGGRHGFPGGNPRCCECWERRRPDPESSGGKKQIPASLQHHTLKSKQLLGRKAPGVSKKSLALQDSVPPGRVQPVPPPDTVRGRSQGICLPSEHPRCYRAARLFRDLSCLSSGGVISSGRSSRAQAALRNKHSRSCAPRHGPLHCSTGLCTAPQPPAVPTRGQWPPKGADVSPELLRQWGQQPRASCFWCCPRPHTHGPPPPRPQAHLRARMRLEGKK